MRDRAAQTLSTLHTWVYRFSGGRIGRRLINNDMLLLTTTGRNSGREHTVPLLFLEDGNDVIVIASWGGRDYSPDWYINVEADASVTVQIESERWSGSAAALDEPERSEWWQRAVAAYDGYREYQDRTHRQIPVVILERNERT